MEDSSIFLNTQVSAGIKKRNQKTFILKASHLCHKLLGPSGKLLKDNYGLYYTRIRSIKHFGTCLETTVPTKEFGSERKGPPHLVYFI